MSDDHRPNGSALPLLVGMLTVVAWSYLCLGVLASAAIAVLLSQEQTSCVTFGSSSFCQDHVNGWRFALGWAAGSLLSLVGMTILLAFRQVLVYLHDMAKRDHQQDAKLGRIEARMRELEEEETAKHQPE